MIAASKPTTTKQQQQQQQEEDKNNQQELVAFICSLPSCCQHVCCVAVLVVFELMKPTIKREKDAVDDIKEDEDELLSSTCLLEEEVVELSLTNRRLVWHKPNATEQDSILLSDIACMCDPPIGASIDNIGHADCLAVWSCWLVLFEQHSKATSQPKTLKPS
jgi:hypothetical protein